MLFCKLRINLCGRMTFATSLFLFHYLVVKNKATIVLLIKQTIVVATAATILIFFVELVASKCG